MIDESGRRCGRISSRGSCVSSPVKRQHLSRLPSTARPAPAQPPSPQRPGRVSAENLSRSNGTRLEAVARPGQAGTRVASLLPAGRCGQGRQSAACNVQLVCDHLDPCDVHIGERHELDRPARAGLNGHAVDHNIPAADQLDRVVAAANAVLAVCRPSRQRPAREKGRSDDLCTQGHISSPHWAAQQVPCQHLPRAHGSSRSGGSGRCGISRGD